MLKRAAVLGCLGTLVPVLLVIAGLLFAADVFARRYATGQLSDRISGAVPEASGVHARIRSFPFVGRVAVNGGVTEVGAHISRLAPVRGLVFTDLDVDLRHVVLDGDSFFTSHRVKLTHIGQGTVSVSVTEQALTDALGRTVHITAAGVDVTVLGGRTVQATVVVTLSRQLTLEASSLPSLVVPLPNVKLLPCLPQTTLLSGAIQMRCTFTNIPDAFIVPASAAR